MFELILLTIDRELKVFHNKLGLKVMRDNSPIPELVFGLLHQERLQGITDFIAHVRVREIQASQNFGLQIHLLSLVSVDHLANQHVNKYNVRGIDESDVLSRTEKGE